MKEFYDGSTRFQISLMPAENDKDKDFLNVVDMVRKDDGARCAGRPLQIAGSQAGWRDWDCAKWSMTFENLSLHHDVQGSA
eukprot:2734459-Amphidinium_carterae.1